MIRYAIKRSDGKYMCIFLNKKGNCKRYAELICNNNYKYCKVVKIEIKDVEDKQ